MAEKSIIIKNLLDSYYRAQEYVTADDSTFLSVIQKDYYENYLSRMIAYALSKEDKFVRALLKRYETEAKASIHSDEVDISSRKIICEKNMDGRRADIFIELENPKITITLENKTNTEEHDDQTSFYYSWVSKSYEEYINIFFYLTPSYNSSRAGCRDYINIKYDDLSRMIPETAKDPIVKDLKRHSKEKLGVKNMVLKDYVIDIIKNYDTVMKIISEAKSEIKAYQIEAIQQIKDKLGNRFEFIDWKKYDKKQHTDKTLLVECKETGGVIHSYRLYKPYWYEEMQYYFYVEILFHYNINGENSYGDIRGIKYQRTLEAPSDGEAKVFLEKEGISPFKVEGRYIGFDNYGEDRAFEGEYWDQKNWQKEFIAEAPNKLEEYIDAHDAYFKKLFPDAYRLYSEENL